jgi:hypothetical protein
MKSKSLEYFSYFIALILLILGLYYYGKAYGSEYEFDFSYEEDCHYYSPEAALENITIHQLQVLAYDDCKTYKDKYQFHKENAERCFNDAKNKCWWLPNIDDRDKARYCLTNIGIIIAPGDPQSKLIIAVINTLIQYGLDCSEEWNFIQTKLKWAQYHYEMMEFFDDVMKQYPNGEKNNRQTNQRQVARKNATIPISNIKKKEQ